MVNVLIVDDDRTTAVTLRDSILQGQFRASRANSVAEAQELISSEHFDVAFIDVVLEESGSGQRKRPVRPLGLQLCELVRRRFPHCWIVIYSRLVDEDTNFQHDRFYNAGADDVKGSKWVSWLTTSDLRQYILDGVRTKDKQADDERPLRHEDSWRTKGVLEVITPGTLRKIIRDAIPAGDSDYVVALPGGYSGAFVLRVDTMLDSVGKGALSNIVKLSRIGHPLDQEVRGAPEVGAPLEFVAARASRTSDVPIDGWFYVSSPAVEEAETLGSLLLSRKAPSSKIQRVVAELVSEIIGPIISSGRKAAKTGEDSQLRLSFRMASEVRDSLEYLDSIPLFLNDDDRAAIARIEAFLVVGIDEEWTLGHASPLSSYVHGDFHSGNILVNAKNQVFLIDFARARRFPRLFDVCTLLVDVWLRVLDSSEGNAWDWTRVPTWLESIKRFPPYAPFSEPANSVGLEPWERLTYSVYSHLALIEPPVRFNELSNALMFQLLRFLKFPSITMPKKLLGVRLADLLIEELRLLKKA